MLSISLSSLIHLSFINSVIGRSTVIKVKSIERGSHSIIFSTRGLSKSIALSDEIALMYDVKNFESLSAQRPRCKDKRGCRKKQEVGFGEWPIRVVEQLCS